MELIIGADGNAVCVYGEELNLKAIGDVHIRRASHVEPDASGRWWADLSPTGGPVLGPFELRTSALETEVRWLGEHLHECQAKNRAGIGPAGNGGVIEPMEES